jgi:transcriptional/translational regulatory protein YebC/TACO1
MSGHSKWSTIKRQKGANDAKRGAIFTKLGNQIAIAARSGTDPANNSALAMVMAKAKAANMPMANIERSIQRASDKDSAQLEEIMYEGYGPGGVAILELSAIEAGAEDVFAEENSETVIHTIPTDLTRVRDQLKASGLEITDVEQAFVPNNTIEITDRETARKVINLMNALDDLDDVTTTHTNFDISDNLSL